MPVRMRRKVTPSDRGNEELTPLTAIRSKSRKLSNIWIFHSPKNERRLTVRGDVPFMHLILLEGDSAIAGYDIVGDPFHLEPPNLTNASEGFIRLHYRSGAQEWLKLGRNKDRSERTESDNRVDELLIKAHTAGVAVQTRTEAELLGKEVLFDNWMTLCSLMTRARWFPAYTETELFCSYLDCHTHVRAGTLLKLPGVDPAIMLAVIAKALQQGRVQAELSRSLFGMDSDLKWVRT